MIIFLISLLLNSCGNSNSMSKSTKDTHNIKADKIKNRIEDSRTTPSFVDKIKQNSIKTDEGTPKEDIRIIKKDKIEDKKTNNNRDPLFKELKEKIDNKRFKEWQKTVKSYNYDQYINAEKEGWEYFNNWIEATGQQDRDLDKDLLDEYYQANY